VKDIFCFFLSLPSFCILHTFSDINALARVVPETFGKKVGEKSVKSWRKKRQKLAEKASKNGEKSVKNLRKKRQKLAKKASKIGEKASKIGEKSVNHCDKKILSRTKIRKSFFGYKIVSFDRPKSDLPRTIVNILTLVRA
jgi:hypothetical protein